MPAQAAEHVVEGGQIARVARRRPEDREHDRSERAAKFGTRERLGELGGDELRRIAKRAAAEGAEHEALAALLAHRVQDRADARAHRLVPLGRARPQPAAARDVGHRRRHDRDEDGRPVEPVRARVPREQALRVVRLVLLHRVLELAERGVQRRDKPAQVLLLRARPIEVAAARVVLVRKVQRRERVRPREEVVAIGLRREGEQRAQRRRRVNVRDREACELVLARHRPAGGPRRLVRPVDRTARQLERVQRAVRVGVPAVLHEPVVFRRNQSVVVLVAAAKRRGLALEARGELAVIHEDVLEDLRGGQAGGGRGGARAARQVRGGGGGRRRTAETPDLARRGVPAVFALLLHRSEVGEVVDPAALEHDTDGRVPRARLLDRERNLPIE